MKQTEYKFNGQALSYEILEDGYNIYLGGTLWITQQEPHIPCPDLGYEGSCLKQMEELCCLKTSIDQEPQGLDKKIEELQQQITDMQIALCELYEGLEV